MSRKWIMGPKFLYIKTNKLYKFVINNKINQDVRIPKLYNPTKLYFLNTKYKVHS